MFCGKCGTELEEGSIFCGKCGAPQSTTDNSNLQLVPSAFNKTMLQEPTNDSKTAVSQGGSIVESILKGITDAASAKGIFLLWFAGIPLIELVKMFILFLIPLTISGRIIEGMQGDIYADIKEKTNTDNKGDANENENKEFLKIVQEFILEEMNGFILSMKRIPLYSVLNIVLTFYEGLYVLRLLFASFVLVHDGYSVDWFSISLPLVFVSLISFFVSNTATKAVGIEQNNEYGRKRIVRILVLVCIAIFCTTRW